MSDDGENKVIKGKKKKKKKESPLNSSTFQLFKPVRTLIKQVKEKEIKPEAC